MNALPQRRDGKAVLGGRREPMTLRDLDAVMALERAVYPFPWTVGNFRDSLAAGHDAWLLRAPDGAVRAYSVTMAGVDETHLLNLAVAPDAQGQGLARGLLDALVVDARLRGHAKVWLEVRLSNVRAHAIYLRYGFVEVGMRRGYYPAGAGLREDARVMQLTLTGIAARG